MGILKRVLSGTLASIVSAVLLGVAFGLIPLLSTRGGWSDFVAFLSFHAMVGIPFACFATLVYGIPLYLLLYRLGTATLAALTVCGSVGGLLAAAILSGFEPGGFCLLAGGFGACAGAAFWYGAERGPAVTPARQRHPSPRQ